MPTKRKGTKSREAPPKKAKKMSPPTIDVIPEVKAWLTQNANRIETFRLYADWRMWARFELYSVLEPKFKKEANVFHSQKPWASAPHEEADVLINTRDPEKDVPLIIKIRTEVLTENAGTFEDFSEAFQKDVADVTAWNKKLDDTDYEGGKVLVLGFSSEDSAGSGFGSLQPEKFQVGDFFGWYVFVDIPKSE